MDYDQLVDQFIVMKEEPKNDNEKHDEKNIFLRSLIEARDLARKTILLSRVKERNERFISTIESRGLGTGGLSAVDLINSERRRRILSIKSGNDEEGVEKEGDSEKNSELIPCRLELDHEGYKVSDVLLLPAHPTTTAAHLESVAQQICRDYELPGDTFGPAIGRCLRDQLEEWHVFQGALDGMKVPFEEIGAVPLRLDIIVGLHRLEDCIEVSLDPEISCTATIRALVDTMQSPDERILSQEAYAPFKPLILHNLLEQLMLWRKGIVLGGFHRDARSNALKFHDGDIAVMLNDPPKHNSTRRHFTEVNSFTPIITLLTIEDLEKIQASRERESRRRRRTTTSSIITNTGITNATNTASSTSISKRGTSNAPLNSSTMNSSSSSLMIVNNLTGTVRSPPRTLPTPTSYRGSLHRIVNNSSNGSDDEGNSGSVGPRKRGRKASRR